jgi:hypothetical protein
MGKIKTERVSDEEHKLHLTAYSPLLPRSLPRDILRRLPGLQTRTTPSNKCVRKGMDGWQVIGKRLGRSSHSCRFRFARLLTKTAIHEWDEHSEERLKTTYQKRKASIWSSVAADMGFEGDWRALEAKAFEMGIKSLK